ncbi:Uncharacterised protein [Escherichia coli]|nr:Uncharacterised protein [Escherichia coli]SQM11152.1 Uncharacterised protein [Escherichia coli]SQM25886.1 Uncharacterised protein [Escherichia coli]SQS25827.1 Uncharacterised protein [Escherichia coli]
MNRNQSSTCGLRPGVMRVAARLCLLTQVLFPVLAGGRAGGEKITGVPGVNPWCYGRIP